MADHTHSSSASALRVVVVTPESTVVEASADFVALPLVDGEYGIAPKHSPMIGRLGYGELRIRSGDMEFLPPAAAAAAAEFPACAVGGHLKNL